MKAIRLVSPNNWEISKVEIPSPKKGQVLVKMAYSPINPSDLAFLTGNYGLKKAMPVVPGLEGSGVVVAAGGGILGKSLVGKNVACIAPTEGDGTWAEYMLTDATKCIKLSKNISLKQGAMFFVNPLTAISFIKQAKVHKADLIVMSAGGSALAQMVLWQSKKTNIAVWGIVRKNHENLGYAMQFDSSAEGFIENLNVSAKKFKRVIYFDAVSGGALPYEILNALPAQTKMVIYGRLAIDEAKMIPQNLLFNQNQIEGYWLSKETQSKNLIQIFLDVTKVKKMLDAGFETNIAQIIKIDDLADGINKYTSAMSKGKVLIEF